MFRKSAAVKHNEQISAYLNNGYRFAIVQGDVIRKATRYQWELEIHLKRWKGGKVVEIKSLLKQEAN